MQKIYIYLTGGEQRQHFILSFCNLKRSTNNDRCFEAQRPLQRPLRQSFEN